VLELPQDSHPTLACRRTADAKGGQETMQTTLRKACDTAEELFGMEAEDLVAALMSMGDI
jgi:hypothetical protein